MIDTHLAELTALTSTKQACALLGQPRATHYRHCRPPKLGPPVPRPAPPNKLTEPERQHVLGVLRSMVGVVPAALLAVPLFHYSVFEMGLPLVAFWTMLIMLGWSIGLMIGALLFRYGLAAESYAWASIFLIQPVSGVWYPVAVLPDWLKPVAWALPTTHVFEGMRALVIGGTFRWDLLASAFALNLVYLALGFGAFLYAFGRARLSGQLLQSSE